MQRQPKHVTQKKGVVRSTVLDVQPRPLTDDLEEPSRWERNPEGQVLNNVPVKFVMADGRTETKNVSIQFEKDGEHFNVVSKSSSGMGKVDCKPCRRKRNAPQATLLDVSPKLQPDQPQDTKKWERFPNLARQKIVAAPKKTVQRQPVKAVDQSKPVYVAGQRNVRFHN